MFVDMSFNLMTKTQSHSVPSNGISLTVPFHVSNPDESFPFYQEYVNFVYNREINRYSFAEIGDLGIITTIFSYSRFPFDRS